MKNIILILSTFLMASYSLFSQQKVSIQFIDKVTNNGIEGIYFEYAVQNGISDDSGTVSFFYSENKQLTLSHISYGTKVISGDKLTEIIHTGSLQLEPNSRLLFPVTVVDLRPQFTPNERMLFDYKSKLNHDAANILNQLTSINSIRKSGNYGFDPVFRGFKYDQLNIVMDGAQSCSAACPNRMDPPTSQMAPNMMHRIEVLKGPYALKYGTGFGGTINFIPASTAFRESTSYYGRLSSGFQSNGSIKSAESQIGLTGQKVDFSVLASWSEGNDYKSGSGEFIASDFSRASFGINLAYKISEQQNIRLTSNYNIARDADFPSLPMDLREDDTWLFNLQHDYLFNESHIKQIKTSLYGSFVNHKMDNLLKNLDPRMMNASTDASTQNYGLRTETRWTLGKAQLLAGLDYRSENAEGIRTREFLLGPNAGNTLQDNAWQNSTINRVGSFFELHKQLSQYSFILSGRLEYNNASVNDPSQEFVAVNPDYNANDLNPGISLGVNRSLNDNINIGLWIGHVQRSASITERYINYFPVGVDPYEMLGNPNLKPEVNNQIDLTFEIKTNNSQITFDLFASYLDNYISSRIDETLSPRLPNSPGVRTYQNIENAFKTGVEFEWHQSITNSVYHNLGVAYTYAQDLDLDEALPEIPPLELNYNIGGSFLSNKLKPGVSIRWVAKQSRVSTEFGEAETQGFTLLDLNLGYNVLANLIFEIAIENLLNENYYEHLSRAVRASGTPLWSPGRNLRINASYRF